MIKKIKLKYIKLLSIVMGVGGGDYEESKKKGKHLK